MLVGGVSGGPTSELGAEGIGFKPLAFGGSALTSLDIVVDELVVLVIANLVLILFYDIHCNQNIERIIHSSLYILEVDLLAESLI